MSKFIQNCLNQSSKDILTTLIIIISFYRMVLFFIFPFIPNTSKEFYILNLSNYSYFEYKIKKTDSKKESYGIFNLKKSFCTCYDKNNQQKNITLLSLCNLFNCSKIQIDKINTIPYNLTKWKNKNIYLDSNKYYLFQGINPKTKKCDEEKGFYSCGFFEDIQLDFCVKNADNCPLKLSNKLTLDTILGENSKFILNITVNEKLREYFNNSFTNEIQKSEKVENNIYFDSYSLSKFFIENEISKITNYICEQELEKINIELFFQKETSEIYNNKNIEQNILYNNFYKEKIFTITDFTLFSIFIFFNNAF